MYEERQPVRLRAASIVGRPGANLVEIDGKDITDRVRSVAVFAGVGELTTFEIEYACNEGVQFDGVARVIHVCPLQSDDEGET